MRKGEPILSYPVGEDFEWLATDARGHVARFTTGGQRPVPQGSPRRAVELVSLPTVTFFAETDAGIRSLVPCVPVV